ncbi:MAG: hypothetical protein FWE84_05355 [Firmicutes bacterium]|nr:hypothetical protein [Bacillota bacterium]
MNAEKKLVITFYYKFLGPLVFIAVIMGCVLAATIITYINNEEALMWPVLIVVMFSAFIICVILGSKSYLQDYSAVRKRQFEIIKGTVIKYNKIKVSGGDATTYYYHPVVSEDNTNREIELKVNGTKLNEHYTFIYLKHTRLAKIKEIGLTN